MYREFGRLRKNWPLVDGESKGRVLNEQQIRTTIAFLQRFDVIFATVVVDLNLHTDEQITAHRMIQAEKITEHVTAEFSPEAAQSASEMRARLEKMPNQLYVQSIAMTELVNHVIQKSTLYYSQRKPRELADFHWTLDAKDIRGVTDFEDWWSLAVMPMLQSMSMRKGLITLKEGDYRWFDRSFGKDDLPEYLHGIMPESEHGYLDINEIVRKSFRYKSSHEDLGLQLADILVSTIRRALVGNLQRAGWELIGRLMLRLGPQVVDMISLGAVQDSNDDDLFSVFKRIREEARPVLRTPKGLRR